MMSPRDRIARVIEKRDDACRVLAYCQRKRQSTVTAQRVLAHCDAELAALRPGGIHDVKRLGEPCSAAER